VAPGSEAPEPNGAERSAIPNEPPSGTHVALTMPSEAAGQRLVERLPIYPEHLARPELFEPQVRARCLALATEEGWSNPSARVEAA